MIPSPIEQAQNVLDDADIALCQRVYDQIIALKLITTDATREDLATRIIQSFQLGIKDEDALLRLFANTLKKV
ncbi:hypothetical protein RLEG12_09195 (plasmid) [Rhizobium leguminosarum bv. trifolii CB782]|uniref:hypothetical protein n=1 Tax=Rhizobium hidalgonense TaxID=1538159 RepID=UPI0003E2EA8A|nr:hypothetical protein [Rhizobium hidalgonense]AHG49106.1 hypothetical protein RLEG12_09195 [Rhizobium leguminosarum bv. trifolii CB782]RWX11810.1 hypothetical protein EHI42_23800 [Rhizobium hidalgonense]